MPALLLKMFICETFPSNFHLENCYFGIPYVKWDKRGIFLEQKKSFRMLYNNEALLWQLWELCFTNATQVRKMHFSSMDVNRALLVSANMFLCVDLLFENVLYFSLRVSHICDSTLHHVTVSESLGLVRIVLIHTLDTSPWNHLQKCFSWKYVQWAAMPQKPSKKLKN